jgi:hypothetical protein
MERTDNRQDLDKNDILISEAIQSMSTGLYWKYFN